MDIKAQTANSAFTQEEREKILHALKYADSIGNAEIRLHVEHKLKGFDLRERARDLFNKIGIGKKESRAGLFVYAVLEEDKVVLVGDELIRRELPEGFLEEMESVVSGKMKTDGYPEGLVNGIVILAEMMSGYLVYKNN